MGQDGVTGSTVGQYHLTHGTPSRQRRTQSETAAIGAWRSRAAKIAVEEENFNSGAVSKSRNRRYFGRRLASRLQRRVDRDGT